MTHEIDLNLKLWVVLSRTYHAVAAHAQADVARHGLTVAEFGILEALHHKGPMLLGEVQRKILVSSGGISYLVDRLESKGLVERRECPEDRRARYVALTPEGLAHALSGLDEDEKREAIRLLRALGKRAAELEADDAPRRAAGTSSP